LSLRGLAA